MGQIISWIRSTRDQPGLQDVTVEQQSQHVTPTPTSQVSSAKPAQYEKGPMQSSTASAAVKPVTSPATSAASSVAPSTVGAAGVGGSTTTQEGPSQVTPQATVSKPTPASSAKVPTASSATGPAGMKGGTGVKPTDPVKNEAQSTTVPSSKPGPAKVDPAVGKPSATAGAQKQTSPQKVQVEVGPPGTKVSTEEKNKPTGVPEKPKDVPMKTETIGAVDVSSAGISNFAPPPPYQQKQPATSQPATVTKSPAPPADKKAKLDIPKQATKPKTDESESSMSLDALSALGDTLGAPEPPKKLPELKPGQIVDEKKLTSEKGVRVGERDDTLPPAYRFSEEELMKYPPPKKEPTLSTDDALDMLSEGFTAPAAAPVVKASVPPSQETKKPDAVPKKTKDVPKETKKPSAVPEKTKDVPKETKKPAGVPVKTKDVPKHEVDELSALDALAGDFVAPVKSASKVSSAAPIPPGPPQKPQTDEDALSALGDTLNAPEPPKKLPELKPGDIVHEKDVTSEKGVRVGERDDTLPPAYRFSEEELMKYPPPKKEPTLSTDDALDMLSEGFTAPAAAPVVKASVPPSQETKKPDAVPKKTKDVPKETKKPSAVPEKIKDVPKKPAGVPVKTKDVPKHEVDELSALDALAGDFVAPVKSASKVSSAAPIPPGPPQKPQTDEDALSALGDTLNAPEPPKKLPELKPGDIVHEKDVTSEKGVRVGERDDTLPPAYRFSEEELMKYPPPKKEASLDTTEALDILSGDFTTPTVPSAAKTPVCSSSKTAVKPSGSASDFALDALSGDFVAPSSASKVQSAVSGPPPADILLSESTSSALDALSDTLGDIKAAPEPAPVPPRAIVKEKDIKEEKVSKPGERDDTLPPDHRFREEDRKSSPQAFEAAKLKDFKPKQTPIDDTTALDLLSRDFSSAPTIKPSAPDAQHFTPEPTPPTHKASGPVLDQLAGKLIPNLTDPKAKDSKPKKQPVEDSSALDQLPRKVSSDVVPSSSTKGGNR